MSRVADKLAAHPDWELDSYEPSTEVLGQFVPGQWHGFAEYTPMRAIRLTFCSAWTVISKRDTPTWYIYDTGTNTTRNLCDNQPVVIDELWFDDAHADRLSTIIVDNINREAKTAEHRIREIEQKAKAAEQAAQRKKRKRKTTSQKKGSQTSRRRAGVEPPNTLEYAKTIKLQKFMHDGDWTWFGYNLKPAFWQRNFIAKILGATWGRKRKMWYIKSLVTKEYIIETIQTSVDTYDTIIQQSNI
jgi:hypothetical protein